jgi:cell division protein YceG involved in septum cleavage
MENLAVGTGLDQFQEPSSRRFSRKWLYALLLVIVGIICIGWFAIFPPASTPKEVTVVIPSGMTSRQTGELLQSHGVVR